MYDVIIIGGGVVGCAIARELSKKIRRIAVLEKASDIGEGASKANSGIVHAGFDATAGSLKALLNVKGNRMMPLLAEELDFPYRNNGSLVLCFADEDRPVLEALRERGIQNGVSGLTILTGIEVRKREPAVSGQVRYALFAPTGGIVCPFGLTVAMAENAADNGVEFYRQTEVTGIERKADSYQIFCHDKSFTSRVVVNAAGIYADAIHNMICGGLESPNKSDEHKISTTGEAGSKTSESPNKSHEHDGNPPIVSAGRLTITPRKGEYLLYDKNVGNLVSHTLFQLPTAYGKGVLITPTVHGNLMIGPTAEDITDKRGTNTTGDGLATVREKAGKSVGKLPDGEVITSFAGLRANSGTGDFIIGEVAGAPGFFDVAGIDSPGLTSAPAIGTYVAELVERVRPAESNPDFIKNRTGIKPGRGEVICRCEGVTREEILAAIRRTPGAVSLDGVKRRTRAGMGRCQAGFCSPRVAEILAQELGREPWEITKAETGSEILCHSLY